MKKILFLLIGLFAFVALQAQDFGITPKGTYHTYTGVASDTVQSTNSLDKVVLVNKSYIYLYNVTVDIDTLAVSGGTGAVSCILAGSNDNVFYTTISDVTFAGTADTTFNYSDVSTGVLWRYLRLRLTGDGSSSRSELQKLVVKVAPKP